VIFSLRYFSTGILMRFVMCLVLLSSLSVQAQTQLVPEPIYNVFSFSSEASAEVDNDLMIATLAVQAEDKDSGVLASKVNAAMSWAVNTLRPFPSLKKTTREYLTYPRYDTSQARRLIGWRATQTLLIETDDFKAAGKAIQKLQERLQVKNIRLTVKPATRKSASDALMNQALIAFKDRARLIQTNMGASDFRILDVNVQDQQGGYAASQSRGESYDMMRSAVVSEPAIEAGTSRVSVQVFGRVQLQSE